MVIDGIQGAAGVKLIRSAEVPKVLAIGGPCHVPRICRIWCFTLTFGALQFLTVFKETKDLGGCALPECQIEDRINLSPPTPRPSLWLRRMCCCA